MSYYVLQADPNLDKTRRFDYYPVVVAAAVDADVYSLWMAKYWIDQEIRPGYYYYSRVNVVELIVLPLHAVRKTESARHSLSASVRSCSHWVERR